MSKPQAKVLVLRTCDKNLKSHSNFTWPKKGPVKCPDFKPTKECGNGLHGFLWGEGNGSLANWDVDAKWLVVEVLAKDIIELDRKVKFPKGKVVFVGGRLEATNYLAERAPNTVKAIIGHTSTSGYAGTSTSGHSGTSTSGDHGTSTSGDYGTSTSGYFGTSTSGVGGTSTSGHHGTIICKWWDAKAGRYKLTTGCVGEDGIEANVKYKADENGKLVKA